MKLPNGYGSVYKLSGKRRKPWSVRRTKKRDNGQGRPEYEYLGYFETRAEALTFLAAYNQKPYDVELKKLTVEGVYKRWTKKRYADKGKSIPNSYAAAFVACSDLHDFPMAALKATHMQRCIDAWNIGTASKKNLKILFSFLFKDAIADDIIDKDYSSFLELPPMLESRLHKPFLDNEIDLLWENVSDKAAQYVLILIYTGMRPTELIRMEIINMHMDARYMIGGIKTAAGKHRAIPIANKIYSLVEGLYDPNNKMFMTDYDGPLNYDKFKDRYWDPLMTKLGLDHKPHDGRHTCATLLDNADANKTVIKRILGHAGTGTTEKVYTHKTVQQLLDAINLI